MYSGENEVIYIFNGYNKLVYASFSAPAIRFVRQKFGCISAADDEISILEEEQEPENSIFESQVDSTAAVAARNQSE